MVSAEVKPSSLIMIELIQACSSGELFDRAEQLWHDIDVYQIERTQEIYREYVALQALKTDIGAIRKVFYIHSFFRTLTFAHIGLSFVTLYIF